MKKGDILEGIIEKVVFPNKGVLHADSKTVIVKNGVPGQKVRFSITKLRHGKAEGRILEVLEKAANELPEPACRHFGSCGGCSYQNLPYQDQLVLKQCQVEWLLSPVIPHWDHVFEGILPSPQQFGYRNKMEFTFGDEVKDGPLSLGMHKRGSFYDIVPVTDCQIVSEDFRKVLRATLSFFQERKTPYYHRMRHEGYLRHLLVRQAANTGEMLVDLVTTGTSARDACGISEEEEKECLAAFSACLQSLPLDGKLAGILHTVNDSLADTIQNDGTTVLFGQDYFEEVLLGLKFKISPFSFFQTNSLGAEVLYQKVREYAGSFGEAPVLFDLYSGTGTIAQILSPAAGKVVGVEIVPEAVEAAKENAARNHLDNCSFLCGDVLKVLDEVEEKPDYIILDPPRDGIHPKALKKIIAYNVPAMVYVSCKPTSLQRDLVPLQAAGYEVVRCCCVDMFPATANVETVCLLSKLSETKNHISVKVDMDEMDVTATESKATYQ